MQSPIQQRPRPKTAVPKSTKSGKRLVRPATATTPHTNKVKRAHAPRFLNSLCRCTAGNDIRLLLFIVSMASMHSLKPQTVGVSGETC